MTPLFVPKDRKSLFRQFLAGMYDAVVITDPNGHIIEINPRAEEYFGHFQDAVVDRPISLLIPGLTSEIVQRLRRGLEDDRHMMVDAKGLNKDGSKFACEVAVSMIDLMDPGDLVFTVRNIARRQKIRAILRSKENAFHISHSALFCCDKDGLFNEANEEFLSLFGIKDIDELRRLSFSDLMNEAPLLTNFQKAIEGEKTTIGIVAEADDTDQEEIEVILAPNRDGKKIVGVVGSVVKV